MHAFYPFVFIEYPDHYLLVGIDIGGRDVFERPYIVRYGAYVPPRDLFKFIPAQFLRVDDDAAFRAAEGNIYYGTFKYHKKGQVPDMVNSELRVEPQSPFGGSSGIIVLHPVADEHLYLARIHPHREMDGERAPWHIEKVEFIRCQPEVRVYLSQFTQAELAEDCVVYMYSFMSLVQQNSSSLVFIVYEALHLNCNSIWHYLSVTT